MEIETRLLDAVATLSKAAMGVLVSIGVTSAYLLQRSVNVMVAWTDPLSTQPQTSYLGLAFSFLTLSVLWPIVLGGLCVAFRIIADKRSELVAALAQDVSGLDRRTIHRIDPFAFKVDSLPGGTRLLRILFSLPVISILVLMLSQLIAFLRFAGGVGETQLMGEVLSRLQPGVWAGINLVVQTTAVALSLLTMRGFKSRGLILFSALGVDESVDSENSRAIPAPNQAPADGRVSRPAEGQ